MANPYDKAGADAASDMQIGDYFRQIIANDPDVQAVIRRVWGNTPTNQRPSDTPKHLEKANDQASKEIERILASKGITLPERSFINPRSGQLEGHRGWSGLNGWQKAAIIGAAAATGVGAGMALAGGGAAAAGAGGGIASGVPAGLPGAVSGIGAAATGAGAAGTVAGTAGVGSILSRVPDILRIGGNALAAYGNQSAQNRGVAEDNQLTRDSVNRQSINDYNNSVAERARVDMERRKAAADLQNNNFLNSIRSSRILNWNPATRPEGIPTISFVGNGVGAQGRAASEAMNRQALIALLEGQKFDPLPQIERYTPAPAPRPGTMEKVSNVLGPVLSVAGLLKGLK